MVYPAEQSVLMYTLNEAGKYEGRQPYSKADKISPGLFPELTIDLEEVFPEMDLAEEDWGEYVRL
jgi:Uma2 family endonuclease